MEHVSVDSPDIADGEVLEVIELLVETGESVALGQPMLTLESSSRAVELPSPYTGVVGSLLVGRGDQVARGDQLLTLKTDALLQPPGVARDVGVTVALPYIGDFDEVAVIEVLIKVGDVVAAEQNLITVESDKASMEIPAPFAGVVEAVLVKMGDKVTTGSPFLVLRGHAKGAACRPAIEAKAETVAEPSERLHAAAVVHDPMAASAIVPLASPSVRKFASELGVPLEEITGTGPKNRITQEDVQAFTKAVMSGAASTRASTAKAPAAGGGTGQALGLLPWPTVDFTKFGVVERKDLSRIKKISGANLHRNWVMIPHVTNHEEADITELEALRIATNKENEKSGVKVTILAFVIKAMVSALKKFPDFNTSLDGDQLVYKQYYNIGFAVDTPNGLVVPVLKDADKKGVLHISQEMGDLARKARDGKLGSADMQGGCISISSLGGIGGRHFTPIINAPEVAILGLSKGNTKPVWDGKAFHSRLILPLSLSYDHRVIDGASAARFNAYLCQVLADFRRVLL